MPQVGGCFHTHIKANCDCQTRAYLMDVHGTMMQRGKDPVKMMCSKQKEACYKSKGNFESNNHLILPYTFKIYTVTYNDI